MSNSCSKESIMTIDEAIEHCKEVAKKSDTCEDCANAHLQLASWLEELKELRVEKERLLDEWCEMSREKASAISNLYELREENRAIKEELESLKAKDYTKTLNEIQKDIKDIKKKVGK